MSLSVTSVFHQSWDGIKNQLPLVAGLSLVYGVGIAAVSMIPFLGGFVSTPLTAGYLRCLLQIRSGKEIGYSDIFWAFSDFNRFGQFLLAGLVVGLLTVLGFVLFVFPGIWFLVASSLTTSYLVLKDTDALAAIRMSKDAIAGHWWKMALLLLSIGLLLAAGALCFFVGLLIATPVSSLMFLTAAETLDTSSADPNSTMNTFESSPQRSILSVNPQ